MIMAQGDYLPGTYSRGGIEENPGTYFGGGAGGGTSQTMPPKVKKVWVLDNDKWNMRNYWISGGKFRIPAVWVLTKGIWDNFGKWMKDGVWRMIQTIFSTDNIWRDNFVWYNDLKFKF
jgi:hypothetical protein|nr:MAG TPA: hypothetical protein [Bacteriophage sp.]